MIPDPPLPAFTLSPVPVASPPPPPLPLPGVALDPGALSDPEIA